MSTPIQGVVIRIPDEYTVIINVGREHGVKPGMNFFIYVEGEDIRDTTSGRTLGKIEHIKAKVTVTHIQEKFSTAKNLETETISPAKEAMRALTGEFVVTRKLPVNPSDMRPLTSFDTKIRVGDKAKQIVEE